MITGELKEIFSSDVDFNSYWPENTRCFSLWLQLAIGSKESDGADNFQLHVCTPEWIEKQIKERNGMFPINTLIVGEYDPMQIETLIRDYCASCIGETWEDVAKQLAKIARWEFENYYDYVLV